MACTPVIAGPIVWHLCAPATATRLLGRFKYWLVAHEREINLNVLLVFGTVFALKGLRGL